VHQVAQAITPGARVVYVDNDPMVLAHSRALKTGEGTAVIHADLRDPDTILAHPDTRRLIDFSQPLAVLFVAVLHFVGDPDAHDAVARFTGAAAPGSYLVLSHGSSEPDPQRAAAGAALLASTASPVTPRTRKEILEFFAGLEILEPGLVPVQQWRRDERDAADPGKVWLLGGVGRTRPDHVAVPVATASRSHVSPPRDSGVTDERLAAGADRQPPPGIDASVATAARMYDYWLGGHDNFAADRIAALKVSDRSPEAPLVARGNRKFLGRAVQFLAREAGIRQFLDLGTGLPTRGNVHQVAQAITPGARVIYVDNDPMVLAHSRALKTGEGTAVIRADLRDPDTILGHPDTRRLIDFSEPLAILFVAVLHFIGDPDAGAAVARFTGAAAPGSYLVLSHITGDPDPEAATAFTAVYAGTANPNTLRTRKEILGFFDGLEMLEPGLVPVPQWRPDDPGAAHPQRAWMVGGVGRKPA
jgi:hypothetical protein